tara:strand:+ start:531 stop:908 length:378 start_codon:yes stop_codon:yes gene_type:complete
MAHFAQIDENNIVINVTVVADTDCQDEEGNESEAVGIAFNKSLLGEGTNWIQTSYNNRIRKNFAGVGFTWDANRDAFIPPIPYTSWVLDESTCQWESPVPLPTDCDPTKGIQYEWDEDNTQWIRI